MALAGCNAVERASKQAGLWPPGETEIIVSPGERIVLQFTPSTTSQQKKLGVA